MLKYILAFWALCCSLCILYVITQICLVIRIIILKRIRWWRRHILYLNDTFFPYYIILKSIPSKIGGAVAMGLSMACLFILPSMDFSKRSWVETKFVWDFSFCYNCSWCIIVRLIRWKSSKCSICSIESVFNILLFLFLFCGNSGIKLFW